MDDAKDVADMLASAQTELPPSSASTQPNKEEIAARAYQLYESNGRVDGRALDDWLQAERDLKR